MRQDHFYFHKYSLEGKIQLLEYVAELLTHGISMSAAEFGTTYDNAFDMKFLQQFQVKQWLEHVCKGAIVITKDDSISSGGYDVSINNSTDDISSFSDSVSFFVALFDRVLKGLHSTNRSNLSTSTVSSRDYDHLKTLASLVSHCFAAGNGHYVDPLSLIAQICIKAKTTSDWVVNCIGKLLPGGVSASYIEAKILQAVKETGSLGDDIFTQRCDTYVVADNMSNSYSMGTTENVKGGNIISIWTNRAVINLYEVQENVPLVQADPAK